MKRRNTKPISTFPRLQNNEPSKYNYVYQSVSYLDESIGYHNANWMRHHFWHVSTWMPSRRDIAWERHSLDTVKSPPSPHQWPVCVWNNVYCFQNFLPGGVFVGIAQSLYTYPLWMCFALWPSKLLTTFTMIHHILNSSLDRHSLLIITLYLHTRTKLQTTTTTIMTTLLNNRYYDQARWSPAWSHWRNH